MAKNGFKGFIFDLDGTLLDTLPDLTVVANKALAEQGFPERTQAEILSFVGNGALVLMHDAVPGGASQEQVDRAFNDFKRLHERYGHELTEEFDGISAVIKDLKARGKRCAILSNKFEGGVKDVEKRYFPELFDSAHGEREAQGIPRKPDPKGLLLMVEELGLMPEECVYFGDSTVDVEVAKRAGLYAVAVTWGYQSVARLSGAGPDAMIDRPDQIIDFA